jgi:FlaA1/EpsC-like NDP-sugar epimerase
MKKHQETINKQASMPRVYIFGSGPTGKGLLPLIQKQYQIIGFVDNDETRWGSIFEGFPVCKPDSIMENNDYDMIIIASLTGFESIIEQLLKMGVKRGNINNEYVVLSVKSRKVFLEKLGELFQERNVCWR